MDFSEFFSNLLNLPDIEFFLLKVSASRSRHLTLMYDNALSPSLSGAAGGQNRGKLKDQNLYKHIVSIYYPLTGLGCRPREVA